MDRPVSNRSKAIAVVRDNAWQFVGVVVSVITLGITIWLFLMTYEVHKLEAVILSTNSLKEAITEFSPGIEIRFRGQPVDDLLLVDIKLANVGNQPVTPSEFYGPLSIEFPEGTRVLDAQVREAIPEDLRLSLTISSTNIVEVAPVLLNPSYGAVIRVIAADMPIDGEDQHFGIQTKSSIARISPVSLRNALQQDTGNRGSLSTGLSRLGLLVAGFVIASILGWLLGQINVARNAITAVDRSIAHSPSKAPLQAISDRVTATGHSTRQARLAFVMWTFVLLAVTTLLTLGAYYLVSY